MIIGICGLIGSGKGTVADILEREHGFIKLSFADSLKDAIAAIFCWPREMLEGDTAESREWREQVDPWWSKRLEKPNLTPRWILQNWGTEVCRGGFHQDIWIASMERKLLTLSQSHPTKNFVIPDTRFPNEIDMIKSMGGKVWKVSRGHDPDWFTNYAEQDVIPNDVHPSEWMWAKSNFNCIIYNDSTLENLHTNIRNLLTDAI